jgi:hypothetical protein
MARLIIVGYRDDDLWALNRVRKHQQVLFLSNILGAGSELLDKQYLQKRRETDRWSMMKFPRVWASEMGVGHYAGRGTTVATMVHCVITIYPGCFLCFVCVLYGILLSRGQHCPRTGYASLGGPNTRKTLHFTSFFDVPTLCQVLDSTRTKTFYITSL